MFELRDLFQWERFITPSIIKISIGWPSSSRRCSVCRDRLRHWPDVDPARSAAFSPFWAACSAPWSASIMARISAEFVLIVFRMNEHLGAIRNQRGM